MATKLKTQRQALDDLWGQGLSGTSLLYDHSMLADQFIRDCFSGLDQPGAGAQVALVADQANLGVGVCHKLDRAIRGSIVHDKYFKVVIILCQDCIQTGPEILEAVPVQNNNRDRWQLIHMDNLQD